MAQLKGEDKGRRFSGDSRSRTFIVRADSRSEYAEDILAAVPVTYGQWHPNSFGYYAKSPDVTQDSRAWWKWVVTWNYARIEANEDPESNPDENPLLNPPDISIDFQTIEVDAKGEKQDDDTYRAIKNSASEPYDPHPREDLEIMLISIVRNEAPSFSVKQLRKFQNATNLEDFIFGDETIEPGNAKLRIRVGTKQTALLESSQTKVEYRSFEYLIAVNPLGWDIELLDWGPSYIDGSGNKQLFVDTDNQEFGLLDGSGGKLADDGTPFFLTWENKERVSFDELNLPEGP